MQPAQKNILYVLSAIVLCIICFWIGQCTANGGSDKLRDTIIELQKTNKQLEQRNTELGEYITTTEAALEKLRDYQFRNEKDITAYRETIKRYEEIVSRIKTNKTEAGRTIEEALHSIKRIKELIITEDGN